MKRFACVVCCVFFLLIMCANVFAEEVENEMIIHAENFAKDFTCQINIFGRPEVSGGWQVFGANENRGFGLRV